MEAVLEELAPLCVGGKKTREAWEELNSLCGLLKANGLAERSIWTFLWRETWGITAASSSGAF